MTRSRTLAAAVLLALAGCATTGATAAPSPCPLQVLWNPPDRPFDVVGEFTELVRMVPANGAPEVFREDACALGADALLVTKHVVTNVLNHTLVSAQAIRWRKEPAPAPPTPPAAAPAPEAAPAPPAPARAEAPAPAPPAEPPPAAR